MENKKTKLTISGNPKKSFDKFGSPKTQGKKTVLIDKQSPRVSSKGKFNKSLGPKSNINFKKGVPAKPNFIPKAQTSATDFDPGIPHWGVDGVLEHKLHTQPISYFGGILRCRRLPLFVVLP